MVHPIGHPVVYVVGTDHGVADGTDNCVLEGTDHVSAVWRRRRRRRRAVGESRGGRGGGLLRGPTVVEGAEGVSGGGSCYGLDEEEVRSRRKWRR